MKAYGAGLLSSYGETMAMHEAEIRPLDFADMEGEVKQHLPESPELVQVSWLDEEFGVRWIASNPESPAIPLPNLTRR